jgi:hypothetical protein
VGGCALCAAQYLKTNHLGVQTFLPLDSLRVKMPQFDVIKSKLPANIHTVMDVIEKEPRYTASPKPRRSDLCARATGLLIACTAAAAAVLLLVCHVGCAAGMRKRFCTHWARRWSART